MHFSNRLDISRGKINLQIDMSGARVCVRLNYTSIISKDAVTQVNDGSQMQVRLVRFNLMHQRLHITFVDE